MRIPERYYINDNNSMNKTYKTKEILNVQFIPSMYIVEKTLSEIKLFKDKKLI